MKEIDIEKVALIQTNEPKNFWKWITGFVLATVSAIVVVIIVILVQLSKTTTKPTFIVLEISDLLIWSNAKQWNIVQYDYGKELLAFNSKQDALSAKYPKGSWAPSAGDTDGYGGFNFYAQPAVFPCREICFKYDVMFDQTFQWVKGGKRLHS